MFSHPNFCYLPRIYFVWHLSAQFLKLLTNNLHCTYCWQCVLTVNALCMFLGSCIIAVALVYCAICSVTNGLIRTWKIYKQFNISNGFTERFSSRQGWANGNWKDGGVQQHLWCIDVKAFPQIPCIIAHWWWICFHMHEPGVPSGRPNWFWFSIP